MIIFDDFLAQFFDNLKHLVNTNLGVRLIALLNIFLGMRSHLHA